LTVYVDRQRNPYRGMVMCHMLADTEAELHAMADRIGARREWYQRDASTPHYDVPLSRRAAAIEFGAVEIGRRETVAIIRRIRTDPTSYFGDVDLSRYRA
jgi:hypothetical protein